MIVIKYMTRRLCCLFCLFIYYLSLSLYFLAVKEPVRHLKRRVFLSTLNSIIAGMVAVAGGAVAYNPWSSIVIGFIAALSFLLWSKLLIKLQIDDPVETAAGRKK